MTKRPDYPYWALRELWEVREAACLLLGVHPGKFTSVGLVREFDTLMDIARDALDCGTLEPYTPSVNEVLEIGKVRATDFLRVRPTDFLQWAKRKGLKIPEELLLLLESRDRLSEVQTEGDDLDPIEDQNAENDAARADVPLFAGGINWVDLEYDERLRQLQSVDEDATPEPDIPTKGQNKTEQRKGDLYSPGHLQVIVDEFNEKVSVRADKNQRERRIYSRADVVGKGSVTWDLLVDFAKCKGLLEGNTQADVKQKNTSGNRINLGNKLMKALELAQSPFVEGRNGVMRFASISLASARRTPDALDRKKIILDDHATADEQATAFLESHGEDLPVD